MQVSIEESGAIERKLTITVPGATIDSEVGKRLQNVAQKAKIPGFRPGKAPQKVIRKRYEPQVTHEVVTETINSSYMDALGQEKIVPAGLISIDPTPYEQGQDLQYVATIELFPEVPNPTLSGTTIKKPIVEVAEADVDRTLEDIRKRNTDFVARGGAAEDGDRLTIDFEGTIDGEVFAGGSASDFQFVLGQGQMLEDFDKGLSGASAGDTKSISFTFPEGYGSDEIAGKDVDFSVTVKAVEQPQLPELDDAFAETLGIAEGGLEKMREEIRVNLNRELENRLRIALRDRVMDALFSNNDIPAPQGLVEEEMNRSVEMVKKQLESQGLPADKIDRSVYEDESRKRVILGLIARDIIEKNEIRPDQDQIRARVETMAASYQDPEEYVNWHMADAERRQHIEAAVIEDQIVAKMLETATVEDEKLAFEEFMNPQAPA